MEVQTVRAENRAAGRVVRTPQGQVDSLQLNLMAQSGLYRLTR
ncbi:MAG: hypothetical protein RXO54_03110 [Acidilobus sp.]